MTAPLVIYCDASAPNPLNDKPAAASGWGAVFVRSGKVIGEASGKLPRMESVVAEFKAVRYSLEHALANCIAKRGSAVIVASDCLAVEQYLTPGRSLCRRIELAAIARGIRRLADKAALDLVATWVPGHAPMSEHGKHNCRADRLAGQAAGVIPTDEEIVARMLAAEAKNREANRERSRLAAEARRQRGRDNVRVDLEWQRLKRERWQRLARDARFDKLAAEP